jgi:hypothetical protein
MNVDVWELVARLMVALMATGTSYLLIETWRRGKMQPRPLLLFLMVVVIVSTLWRYVILWVGMQRGSILGLAETDYASHLEPIIRSVSSALLFLLFLAIALLGYFHLTRDKGSA